MNFQEFKRKRIIEFHSHNLSIRKIATETGYLKLACFKAIKYFKAKKATTNFCRRHKPCKTSKKLDRFVYQLSMAKRLLRFQLS